MTAEIMCKVWNAQNVKLATTTSRAVIRQAAIAVIVTGMV